MLPTDMIAFAITLACALVMLFKWKRRRILNARRVNRGLRGYVSGRPAAAPQADQELSAA